jgi:hypothetical protein
VHTFAKANILKNEICENGTHGVAVANYADPTISHSVIHDMKRSGIFLTENATGKVLYCDIYGNGYANIEIVDNAAPYIRGNTIHDSKQVGIFCKSNG